MALIASALLGSACSTARTDPPGSASAPGGAAVETLAPVVATDPGADSDRDSELDAKLSDALRQWGFTGQIQESLVSRLGRPLNPDLVEIGRLLWFDTIHSLGNDNTCAGCHSPTNGFGDSQSIAVGVENNGVVGPHRAGPRNQRRSPLMINTAFYPGLMWNARFSAISHDPFDMSLGARVPFFLGGTTVWVPGANGIKGTFFDPDITRTLLSVQGNFPPTELIEVAGFAVDDPENLDPRLYSPPHLVSSGLVSDTVPAAIPGPNGSPPDSIDRSYSIRAKVIDRLNANPEYVARFAAVFPSAAGGNITFAQFGAAVTEFELFNTFANAPLDQFARGQRRAMSSTAKRGALLFFGKAGCVQCHTVAAESNEMFSDFQNHDVGVPQVAPSGFGLRPGGDPQNPADFPGNNEFAGSGTDEDFGQEELTADPVDRYRFRTAPLRNLAVAPAFFHNGAFVRLRDAIDYHAHTLARAHSYSARDAGLAPDLTVRLGPIDPVLKRIDPRIVTLGNRNLSPDEVDQLTAFVRDGLLDPGALPQNLCKEIPDHVPSGRPIFRFEGCE